MGSIVVAVPAKLLLSGEHSVLLGMPAAGMPLPLQLRLTLTTDRDRKSDSDTSAASAATTASAAANRDSDAKTALASNEDSAPRFNALAASENSTLRFNAPAAALLNGYPQFVADLRHRLEECGAKHSHIAIDSDIPIGSGLGSSAALCVACATALHSLRTRDGVAAHNNGAATHNDGATRNNNATHDNNDSAQEYIWNTAHQLEHHFHGTSSGVDTGIIALNTPTIFSHSAAGAPRSADTDIAINKSAPRIKITAPFQHYHRRPIVNFHVALAIIVVPRHATTKQMIATIGAPAASPPTSPSASQSASPSAPPPASPPASPSAPPPASPPASPSTPPPTSSSASPPADQHRRAALAAFCAESARFAEWLAQPRRELDEGHARIRRLYRLQRQLGMSTAAIDAFIARARAAGAVAGKVSGAGAGGCAFALFADGAALSKAMPTLRRYCAQRYRHCHLYGAQYADGAWHDITHWTA